MQRANSGWQDYRGTYATHIDRGESWTEQRDERRGRHPMLYYIHSGSTQRIR